MTGLKRGTVKLSTYREEWKVVAGEAIGILWAVFADAAEDIQHVGSTAIPGMKAKPIVDIAVGVRNMKEVMRFEKKLEALGIRCAGENVPDQILFVMGDFEKDIRTHHIHVVRWNAGPWKNYIRFRDYLRAFPDKAEKYAAVKEKLAMMYPDNRMAYTQGKADIVENILQEANRWAEGKRRAKAILLCGRIASGKTVYAQHICKEENAVLLSVDEITIGILGGDLGEKHDEIAQRTQKYLFGKSLEILSGGASILLDWGFWTREKRREAREFYESRGIPCEFHYLDTPDEVWEKNIKTRNQAVLQGKTDAYYVDEGLRRKLEAAFEIPEPQEIDVWYKNVW